MNIFIGVIGELYESEKGRSVQHLVATSHLIPKQTADRSVLFPHQWNLKARAKGLTFQELRAQPAAQKSSHDSHDKGHEEML